VAQALIPPASGTLWVDGRPEFFFFFSIPKLRVPRSCVFCKGLP
jgi:hypothetical protein